MDKNEFRQMLNAASTTPWERFKYWCIKWAAIIGFGWLVLQGLIHLDEIAAWMNGK